MAAIFSRLSAWHRRLEQRARRRHLIHSLSLVADESHRLGQPELGQLLFLTADLWASGHGARALEALERETRVINAEVRFGHRHEGA